MMLTGVRTQELRFARWEDINFNTRLWEIPAREMMQWYADYVDELITV